MYRANQRTQKRDAFSGQNHEQVKDQVIIMNRIGADISLAMSSECSQGLRESSSSMST